MAKPKKNNSVPIALLKLQQHPLILGLIGLMVGGAVLFSFMLHDHMQGSAKQALANASARNYAQQQVAVVNTYLKKRQQQLQNISEKQLFIEGLSSGDTKEVAHLESLLTTWAEDLSQGYLLSPSDTRLDESHNFVGQEMSTKVLSGEPSNPIAAHIDGAWKLMLAFPLKDSDGKILGSLMAMLSTGPLTELLRAKVKPSLGTTELIQTVSGLKNKPFIALSSADRAMDAIILETRIPQWQVRFTGSSILLNQATPPYREFLLIVAGLIITTLLLIYVVVRLTLKHHKGNPKKLRLKKNKDVNLDETKLKAPAYDDTPVDEESASYLQVIPSHTDASNSEKLTEEVSSPESPAPQEPFPDVVFRDYDIRGLSNTQLTPEFSRQLGKVLAKRALSLGEHTLIVACDGRNSTPKLSAALEQGILSTGCNIIHLGQAPTPLLNFATHVLPETDCGVMVTASHNPAEYNGFKMFFKHHALCGEEIQALKTEMSEDIPEQTSGHMEIRDLSRDYVQSIASDIVPTHDLKVVLDAGNGVAGELGIDLLEAIGCTVLPLYCDVDGDFPNHPPDTSVEAYLDDLILCVRERGADLGIALDGDGDRVVAVSASGKIIWPDELLMIFARDVVSRHPGADVVFDIKSTRRLNSLISSYGGRPVMWKTGHSHMYNKIIECNAPLGGEFSGHIFFHDRWHGFDDGIYAAARLVEILTIREQGLDEIVSSFESRRATPEIKVDVSEEEKFSVMERLISGHTFQDGKVTTIDGLRVDFPKAWGLIRASNTSPALTLRFEAESEDALEKIQSLFRQQLLSIDANLTF